MKTITTTKGRYAIRGPHTPADLRRLYASFVARYGDRMTFDEWLGQRGKVYFRIKGKE